MTNWTQYTYNIQDMHDENDIRNDAFDEDISESKRYLLNVQLRSEGLEYNGIQPLLFSSPVLKSEATSVTIHEVAVNEIKRKRGKSNSKNDKGSLF